MTTTARKEISISSINNTNTNNTVTTFNTEDGAMAQLMEWKEELEAEGYAIQRVKGDAIYMSKKANGMIYHAKLYTTDAFISSDQVTNLRSTLCNAMSDLLNAEMFMNQKGANQVVIQLNEEADGEQWKMFVYYDAKHEGYYFSFQNEDYEDTDFSYGFGFMEVIETIEKEVARVGGFEWIESYFG
jgi:hypothetical protein